MKDPLEKFIQENRASFEDKIPSDDVWNNIQDRLPRKKDQLTYWWRAAAVIFMVSTLYLLIEKQSDHELLANDSNTEIQQTENYYLQQINQKKQKISLSIKEQNLKINFLEEINQLDIIYQQLKKVHKKNLSNDKVVEEMIKNLQIRVKLLNRQLHILNNIKTNNDEIKEPTNNV